MQLEDIDGRVFDVVSLADSTDEMKLVSHPSYKKITKGSIDVLMMPRHRSVIIDRRSSSNPPSVYSDIKHAHASMSS